MGTDIWLYDSTGLLAVGLIGYAVGAISCCIIGWFIGRKK